MKFLHPNDPSEYLHWPAIDVKCWMPINNILQLLPIPTVNTSGHPYNFLKREFKDTQKQFTETLWTWKQFYALTNRNSFLNFKQFDDHWKLLKTLDFNTYQGFLFCVLYTFIPGYFNEFIYEIMKWNISKIKKHHNYEVLNLQVYLIIVVLTDGKL